MSTGLQVPVVSVMSQECLYGISLNLAQIVKDELIIIYFTDAWKELQYLWI